MPPPDYSVVVPAWNEEEALPATLRAVAVAMAASPLKGEVVVCDNGSEDGTVAIAEGCGARVVVEAERRIARVRNTGARHALGRHLVFVDADTLIAPGLLQGALERLESGEYCGGGARMVMDVGGRRMAGAAVNTWNALARNLRLAAGSFVWVRRDAFEAVGGFPETVYAGEEVWFSRAVKRWGRERGLRFGFLEEPPVLTSGRKVRWFSTWSMVFQFLVLTLCPPLARSRTVCFTWYRRPPRPEARP